MEVKIIPYNEDAYNGFKDDTIRMQERLLQFFI